MNKAAQELYLSQPNLSASIKDLEAEIGIQIFYRTNRATFLNLMKGLDAYTLCSGIICEDLNGNDYVAIPLNVDEKMTIGYIKRIGLPLSSMGQMYIDELKKYKEEIL